MYLVTCKTASNAKKCLVVLTRSFTKDIDTFFGLDKNEAILQLKGYKCMLGHFVFTWAFSYEQDKGNL